MPTKKPWFKKAILKRKPDTLEGWRKEMPAEKRRADAIASRPVNWTNKKKYLSAARALQALSNVTRDAETKRLAKEDADYFFEKAKGKNKMEGGGSVRTRRNIQRYNYLNIEKQKAGINIMIRHEGVDQVNEWREQHPEWNDDMIMSELFDDVQGNSEYLFVPDGGEAGFGLTNAPMILDGYHYVGEKGKMYDTDYPKSAHVYYFGNYMIISPLEVLLRDKSVFFTEAKAAGGYMEKGGEVDEEMLDQMVKGYMDAVLFTETDDDQEPLDSNYSNEDFDPETVIKIRKMISQYIEENLDAIKSSNIHYDTIGKDIWFAQSGQGAGFFDHLMDRDVIDKLTKGAKKFVDLSAHVFAQDGKVYIEGGWFSEEFEEGGVVKPFVNKFLDLSVLNEKVPLNEIFTKKIE